MSELRQYLLVSMAYWGFMLTDGALRMLCLLYFHEQDFSPVQLACLFVLYEFCGMLTNAGAGWLAQNKGLRLTLIGGLQLQVLALVLLSLLDSSWSTGLTLTWVVVMQAFSGVAKDLTKMSSKSAIKFLLPKEGEGGKMFKWVALLTGYKNAVKGVGFFTGGALLQLVGFKYSLWIMAGGILLILLGVCFLLPGQIGTFKVKKTSLRESMNQSPSIRRLSLARFFLFGARDIWFVIALPLFLAENFSWSHSAIGTFMAFWVIAYGVVQASAPVFFRKQLIPDGVSAGRLAGSLTAVTALILLAFFFAEDLSLMLILGLLLFGAVFALNSSIHSFLIVDYAEVEKTASSVGFYYMANAAGRLIGTLISGVSYQWGGLGVSLGFTLAFCILSSLCCRLLPGREVSPS